VTLRRAAHVAAAGVGLAAVSATVALGAFWSTTSNSGNSLQTGTVTIRDNDLSAAMLSLIGARPGSTDTSCIEVEYTGTLPSTVRLYATTAGTIAPYLTLTVTRGTMPSAFDSCTGFEADGTNYVGAGLGVVYSGSLSAFPTSYASGLVDPYATPPEEWTTGEKHAYRFVVSLDDVSAAQSKSGSATFTWEARSYDYSATVLATPGLVSYWRLDESSGTAAADAGSNPGTYAGTNMLSAASLLAHDPNAAASFNGTTEHVQVPDSASLDFAGTSPFTFEAWIRPDLVDATSRRVFSKEITDAGGTQGYLMYFTNTGWRFQRRLNGANNTAIYSTVPPVAGTTYHFVATYNGTAIQLYVNGVAVGSPTASSLAMIDQTSPLRIGSISTGGSRVQGVIDDAAVYNVALTAAQIREHYEAR
jgi:Concanavalin A-like lectin/glucanases superfamily